MYFFDNIMNSWVASYTCNATTTNIAASLDGHLTTGTVRLWDTSAGASLGDVAGTVAGDVLTVPDTTGMAAGDQVWRTGVSEVAIGTGEIELGAAATGRFVYGSGFATAAGVAKFVRLTTSNTQVRITCSNAVLGNVAGDMIAVGRSSGANLNYVGQGRQSPDVVKCYVQRDAIAIYGTIIPNPSSMSHFGGWIGGAVGSLVMAFTSFSQSQAGPAASNILEATPLEFCTTGSAVVVKTIGLV